MKESSHRVRVAIAFRAHEPVCGRRLVVSPLGRLVAVAEALDVPIALALSNELAHQLARDLPETFGELKRGYAERRVVPIYTPAHQVPASLSTPEELIDELRLNLECVHGLLGAPAPRARVALPLCDPACPSALVRALEADGFALVVTPPGADRLARVGERLLGAPRVAMELWPDRELSAAAVARVVDEAADGALLTFVHGAGDVEAARRAWGELRGHPRVRFVALDELAELERPQAVPPKLRLPPSLTGLQSPTGGEPPSALAGLTGVLEWLVDAFGFTRAAPLGASALFEDDYQLHRLPPRAQVPMRLRLVKGGVGPVLEADERLARRPFQEAASLCDVLIAECRLRDTRPVPHMPLRAWALAALDRLPATLLDPRLAFRHAELEQLQLADLDQARAARWRAEAALSAVRTAHGELRRNRFRGRARWRALIAGMRDLLQAVCDSLEGLDRAGAAAPPFEPRLEATDATIWPAEASNPM